MLNTDIPKIIHYCWFGKNKKPKLVLDCIASWKLFFPDFQLIEWDEETYLSDHPFYLEAMQKKLWAFASDFARLEILYKNGGVYLDTDMLVTKPFDHLLTNNVNVGAESIDFVNAAIVSSSKNQAFFMDCLECYDKLSLSTEESDLMKITIPRIITNVLFNKYIDRQEFNSIIDENGIRIFPPDFFYPLPYESRLELNNYRRFLTENTFGVHLWGASWKKHTALYFFEHKRFIKGISTLVEEIIKRDTRVNKSYIKKFFKILFVKEPI